MDECKPLEGGQRRAEGAAKAQLHHDTGDCRVLGAPADQEDLARGRAVEVDAINPMLKPPGTQRLKLKHDEVPSNFAFNFNLRRYTEDKRKLVVAIYKLSKVRPAR